MKLKLLCMAGALVMAIDVHSQTRIPLSANDQGRVFEGIGAVSAGASSRALIDYPEKQRSEVLDFLFKPKFGAGFQHLKVEIGSGENSTCGSEPSHAITKKELLNPKPRGYEFWLMAEARKRNNKIMLDCLPWAYPKWVGNRFSQASADWLIAFLKVARKNYGLELNYLSAAQNEMGTDLDWIVKTLRPTLDKQGFSKVRLQSPDDDDQHWKIFDELKKKPEADRLISAAGYHYLDGREPWDIDQKLGHPTSETAKLSGKSLWASEEWSNSGKEWDGVGAMYLARLMNKIYTTYRATKFEIWCPFDGMYDQIIWHDTGALQADSPWDGTYRVWPAIWALAHTTQFAEPGWVYMDKACGQFDKTTWRGSHVALRDPKTGNWSVIIVTDKKQKVSINVDKSLNHGTVYIWKSTANQQFIKQEPLKLKGDLLELELDPDAIYSITTTTGQTKGAFEVQPDKKPFPFPYAENFEAYKAGETPKFFSDQKGTFEVSKSPAGGMCMTQIVPEEGILWFDNWLLKPHSLLGDVNWKDYSIEAKVLLKGGDVEIGGRYADRNELGYRWILTRDGRWQLNYKYTTLASGQITNFKPADWHHIRLDMKGNKISGTLDGKQLVTVNNDSGNIGMAFVASTYDMNMFDDIKIEPMLAD